MKLEKIKIISPNTPLGTHNRSFPLSPPILSYLAALTPPEYQVQVIDGSKEKIDFNCHADLICISCLSPMLNEARRIALEFKKRGMIVAVGGHHPTACPEEVKEFADIVFIGEAEITYLKMLEDFKKNELYDFYACGDYPHLKNLKGKVFISHERPDLSKIPLPRKDVLKYKYFFDTLSTVRGCPFDCDFCHVSKYYGNTMRSRPLEEVEKEIEKLGRYFLLMDDNCFGKPQYNMEVFKLLIKSKKKRTWVGSGSLSIVNHPQCDEILDLAVKSGMGIIMVGVESLEPDILEDNNISKKLGHKGKPDIEFTKRAIKKLQSHGLCVWGFLMVGFMDEKVGAFEQIKKFCNDTNLIPCPAIVNLLPGTRLFEKYKDFLISERTYEDISGPLATYYINNLKPYELEDQVYNLEKHLYSMKNIIKRLLKNPIKNWIILLVIQLGMKSLFKTYKKEIIQRRLPDKKQLLAGDIRLMLESSK